MVKYLVEKGADVNAATETGYTALIYSGWNQKNGTEQIKYLVGKKANINAATKTGYNVGMSSAGLTDLKLVKFLHENGFDFSSSEKNGDTSFHYLAHAITCENREELLYYEPITSKEKEISDLVKHMSEIADINTKNNSGDTPLHIACTSVMDYTPIIQTLIANGADVNSTDNYGISPIFKCLGNPKMVKFLVDAGADLKIKNRYGYTCLDICEESIKYNPELSETIEILKSSKQVKKDYTFVQLVEYNYAEKAMQLLKNGKVKNIDDYDSKGYTPLYYAVMNRNFDLAKTLLDKGCDINKIEKTKGTTVLYYAAQNLDLEMVQFLLKYKPDLKMLYKNDDGSYLKNILFSCIYESRSLEVLKCLLEAGADPNLTVDESSGLTLTAMCCKSSSKGIPELLIEYGGNPFTTYSHWFYHSAVSMTYSIVMDGLSYDRKDEVYRGLQKQNQNKVYVATENLRIRDGSSLRGKTLTAIKKGTRVKLLEFDNMEVIDEKHSCWVMVETLPGSVDSEGKKLPDATKGWCFLGYLEQEKQ